MGYYPNSSTALSQGKTSLSLIIYTDADNLGDLVYFYSSESQNTKPTINMTWVYGQRNIPSDVPYTISPTNGQVSFNQTSHAVLPELRPIFRWSLPQQYLLVLMHGKFHFKLILTMTWQVN